MEKEPKVFVEHILDAIARIRTYLRGLTKAQFLKDQMMQDAVIYKFEIIGEASTHLTKDIQAAAPDVPWRDIMDMRNKLIHEYFDIDLIVVWDTAKKDLPVFEKAMKKLKKRLS